MVKFPLTEYEVELVRFCAKHYLAEGEVLGYLDFPRYEELGRQAIVDTQTLHALWINAGFLFKRRQDYACRP